jgi:hypothetical protein
VVFFLHQHQEGDAARTRCQYLRARAFVCASWCMRTGQPREASQHVAGWLVRLNLNFSPSIASRTFRIGTRYTCVNVLLCRCFVSCGWVSFLRGSANRATMQYDFCTAVEMAVVLAGPQCVCGRSQSDGVWGGGQSGLAQTQICRNADGSRPASRKRKWWASEVHGPFLDAAPGDSHRWRRQGRNNLLPVLETQAVLIQSGGKANGGHVVFGRQLVQTSSAKSRQQQWRSTPAGPPRRHSSVSRTELATATSLPVPHCRPGPSATTSTRAVTPRRGWQRRPTPRSKRRSTPTETSSSRPFILETDRWTRLWRLSLSRRYGHTSCAIPCYAIEIAIPGSNRRVLQY